MSYKKIIMIVIGIFFLFAKVQAQKEISKDWKNIILSKKEFEKVDIKVFKNIDLSSILSNQERIQNDPWSTYVGIFGSKYRRIDFHIEVRKSTNNSMMYLMTGKNKLRENIRPLIGKLILSEAIKLKPDIYTLPKLYVCIFEYSFEEPGNKDGDGRFIGNCSIVLTLEDNQPKIFWSESGDFREYNNMFVGTWKRYNSEVIRKCIFSFHPAGLYNELPFCEEIYQVEGDEVWHPNIIKQEYRDYGWQDYDENDSYKSTWWK